MATFLRAALHGAQAGDTTVIMTGPLSEQFTRALNEVFAKKDPESGEDNEITPSKEMDKQVRVLTQESQQIEEELMAQAAGGRAAHNTSKSKPVSTLTVYAVQNDQVQNDDIVNFAKILTSAKLPSDVALIAVPASEQATEYENEHISKMFKPQDKGAIAMEKTGAMRQLALSFGARAYSSLEDFQRALLS